MHMQNGHAHVLGSRVFKNLSGNAFLLHGFAFVMHCYKFALSVIIVLKIPKIPENLFWSKMFSV